MSATSTAILPSSRLREDHASSFSPPTSYSQTASATIARSGSVRACAQPYSAGLGRLGSIARLRRSPVWSLRKSQNAHEDVPIRSIEGRAGRWRLRVAPLGLARAYALSGDIANSLTAYQDFLALWKDADPDIPILKQAKAEYEKLQ
jgi:hypothetical protein